MSRTIFEVLKENRLKEINESVTEVFLLKDLDDNGDIAGSYMTMKDAERGAREHALKNWEVVNMEVDSKSGVTVSSSADLTENSCKPKKKVQEDGDEDDLLLDDLDNEYLENFDFSDLSSYQTGAIVVINIKDDEVDKIFEYDVHDGVWDYVNNHPLDNKYLKVAFCKLDFQNFIEEDGSYTP